MRVLASVILAIFLISPFSQAWGQAEFPDSFKGVIPEYPGALVEVSVTNADGTSVHMETDAEPKAVTDFYKKAMIENGWTVNMDMSHEGGSTLVLNKGNQILNVTAVGKPGERTRLILALMSQ